MQTSPVLVLCALAAAAPAQVLFTDNFDTGPSALWSNERGDWVAPAGEYYASAPSNNPPTATTLPFGLDDLDLEFDAVQINDGGVWLHTDTNINNGVLLVMGGNGGTYPGFYWHTFVEGQYQGPFNFSGQVFNIGDTIRVRVRVRGDTYEVYVGDSDTPASTFTTPGFPAGRVGFYDFANPALRFDNVQLSAPCPADFNDDGVVNTLDVLAFLNLWAAGDMAADFNEDGTVNTLDVLAFLNAWSGGC